MNQPASVNQLPARPRFFTPAKWAVLEIALIAGNLMIHSWIGWALVVLLPLVAGIGALFRKAEQQAIVVEGGDRLTLLKRALGKAQYEPATEKQGERGSEQFKQVQERFKNLDRVLREKLSPSELTFGRYRGAGEEVMNAVFDRLEAAASRLSTVRAMKLDEEMAGEASEREKRQALAREQLAAVDALLAENDRAITEMDKVTASLSDMKAQGDRVSTDLGLLMKDLEELAERTKKFKQ